MGWYVKERDMDCKWNNSKKSHYELTPFCSISILNHCQYNQSELSHQHSREIQQHMSKQSRGSIALQAFQNVTTNIRSVASAAIHSTYQPVRNMETTPSNLSDFGIQDDARADPLLGQPDFGFDDFAIDHESRHPDSTAAGRAGFVFLEQFRLVPKRDGWGAVANLDLFFSVRMTKIIFSTNTNKECGL